MQDSVSILVDYYNLYWACKENKLSMQTILGEIMERGLVNGRQIQEVHLFTPNFIDAPNAATIINDLQHLFGLENSTCSVMVGKQRKDTVDLAIQRYVTSHIHAGLDPTTLVFVSGDGHLVTVANIARMRGKKVEFWNVDPASTHGLIQEQEEFRILKTSPPLMLAEPNSFLEALEKLTNGQEINAKETEKLALMSRIAEGKLYERQERKSPMDEASELISTDLGISPEEAKELLKALMNLDIARIYPAIHRVIDIQNAPIFQYLKMLT